MKICMHVTNYDVSMVLRACILLFHLFGHHKLSESYNFSFFHFSGYVLSQNLILEEVLKWFFFIVAEADLFLWCFPKQAIGRLWNSSIWRESVEKKNYTNGWSWSKYPVLAKKSTKQLINWWKWHACDKLWLFYDSEGLYIVISLNWAPQAFQIIQFFIFSFFGVGFELKFALRQFLTPIFEKAFKDTPLKLIFLKTTAVG